MAVSGLKYRMTVQSVGTGKKFLLEVPFSQSVADLPGKKYGHLAAVFRLPAGDYSITDSAIYVPGITMFQREFPEANLQLGIENRVSKIKIEKQVLRHFFGIEIALKEAQNIRAHFYSWKAHVYFKRPGKRTWQGYDDVLRTMRSDYQDKMGNSERYTTWRTPAENAEKSEEDSE